MWVIFDYKLLFICLFCLLSFDYMNMFVVIYIYVNKLYCVLKLRNNLMFG